MDLLGSLSTLATKSANLTLPGVLAALAFALLIWPPKPYDRIPIVIDDHPDITALRLFASQLENDSQASLEKYLKLSAPACTVREGADSYKFLTIPTSARDRAAVAVKNQLVLDDIRRALSKCAEEEQALQGIEDSAITNLNALIATRVLERDGINTNYQRYVNSFAPLEGEFKKLRDAKENEIAKVQAQVLNLQRVGKERTRRVSQLQRLGTEIDLRLSDAGRLRPTQKFDDVLSGLTNHIVGFLTLVFAWGLLIDPINRAVFSFFYDLGFDDAWDHVRPGRETPGQDAYNDWNGKDPKPLNSEGLPALVVIVVCLLVAVPVIFCWSPDSSLPRATATIICPANPSVCEGDKITVTATVVAPGSADVPTGTVTFLDGNTKLDSEPLDNNGVANYESVLPVNNHTITAKYEGSDKDKGDAKLKGEPNFQSSTSAPITVSVAERVPQDEKQGQTSKRQIPNHRARSNSASSAAESSTQTALGTPQTPNHQKRTESKCEPPSPKNCIPIVPDLGKLAPPPFWPHLAKSTIVLLLAFVVAYFLPGLLRLLPHDTAKEHLKPSAQDVEAFRRSPRAESIETPLTDEQKLEQERARHMVEALAENLGQRLSADLARSSEQSLADSFVQNVAQDLAKKLKDLNAVSLGQAAVKGADELTPTEKKLAEDLVQRLIRDLKAQSAGKQEAKDKKAGPPDDEQKVVRELIQQFAKDLVKKLAMKSSKKPLTCEQKLAKLWEKLYQPQYAIGQGLMLRSDFEALQNSYYSQSLISTGLIIPFFFLVFVLMVTPQFGLGDPMLYVVFGLGEVLLLITGVDRRHKYLTELDSLISSAFLKTCAQNASSASDNTVASQIADALKKAEIMKRTDLKIIPADPPATPPATSTSPGGAAGSVASDQTQANNSPTETDNSSSNSGSD
jgi:hypothetical protein